MKDELLLRLEAFGQESLLAFWDELSEEEQAGLAAQVRGSDLHDLEAMFESSATQERLTELAQRAEPPAAVRIDSNDPPYAGRGAEQVGEQALAAGKVGIALVAGGQGSRLGFDHPKGMYPIGPISHASLFEILFAKIDAIGERFGRGIPLFLMTSPATHQETLDYLETNRRFGLVEEDVTVFCQGTLPAVDACTGKLLLSERDSLFLSPDGHGGMLAALERCRALESMQQRGLEYLFYFQVDNPLATVCDPRLIGCHLLAESEYTLQVIAKKSPEDRVGNVVRLDGMTRVIEYSDLPAEVAQQRNDDGSLKLWAGSIAVHIFDIAFLCRMAKSQDVLPIHLARKKVPFLDPSGRRINPDEPNAIKYERFIFDLLPHAKRALSVEVDPALAFAPLKNASGAATDTVEHVCCQMMDVHRRMLREAGIKVDDGCRVEISPRFAMTVEQLRQKIAPGTTILEDTYFR